MTLRVRLACWLLAPMRRLIERSEYPSGRIAYHVTLGDWQWNTFDWSLSRRVRPGPPTMWSAGFALRCCDCRRFTAGCSEHWWCGLCEACRATEENDE